MTDNKQPDPLQKEEIPQWFKEWMMSEAKSVALGDATIYTAVEIGAIGAYRKLAEERQQAEENNGWTSVDDAPEPFIRVLLYFDGIMEAHVGWLIKGKWCGMDRKPFWCLPSHWMPLPIPPNT